MSDIVDHFEFDSEVFSAHYYNATMDISIAPTTLNTSFVESDCGGVPLSSVLTIIAMIVLSSLFAGAVFLITARLALKAKNDIIPNELDFFTSVELGANKRGINPYLPEGDEVSLSDMYDVAPEIPENLTNLSFIRSPPTSRNSISVILEENEDEDHDQTTVRSTQSSGRPSYCPSYTRSRSSIELISGSNYLKVPHMTSSAFEDSPSSSRLYRSNSQEIINKLERMLFISDNSKLNREVPSENSNRRRSSSGSGASSNKNIFNKTVEMFENLNKKRHSSSEGKIVSSTDLSPSRKLSHLMTSQSTNAFNFSTSPYSAIFGPTRSKSSETMESVADKSRTRFEKKKKPPHFAQVSTHDAPKKGQEDKDLNPVTKETSNPKVFRAPSVKGKKIQSIVESFDNLCEINNNADSSKTFKNTSLPSSPVTSKTFFQISPAPSSSKLDQDIASVVPPIKQTKEKLRRITLGATDGPLARKGITVNEQGFLKELSNKQIEK